MTVSSHMRQRARELRKAPTLSEQRIWNWLRNRSLGGFKFRRQFPIGRYVVDFYCPALKLAIEIDGHQHETAWMAEHDGQRTLYLQSRGIEVVRISNELIAQDTPTVELIIDAAIKRRSAR